MPLFVLSVPFVKLLSFQRALIPLIVVCGLILLPGAPAQAETTLRVGTYGLPKAMGNPHSSSSISEMFVWGAIFDSLVAIDAKGDPQPALAVSWEVIDELTWHFHLRPDVRFSNGEPFDASAVVAIVDYMISEEGKSLSVARDLESLAGASVVDSHTVEIRSRYPNIIMPATLGSMRIVAPGQWSRLGPEGFGRAPVGTGPFMVEKWITARIDLAAFKDSWRAPNVDRLEIYEILDSSARLQAVQTASVDIALNLSPDDIVALERAGGRGHVSDGVGVVGMSFVTVLESPLQNVLVRRALNYAVDKEAYIAVLLDGQTVPGSQPAPRGNRGHNPDLKPYPHDPERARQLLREAGYPDGFDFIAEVVIGGTVAAGPIYQYVAQQLRQVGVNMEVGAAWHLVWSSIPNPRAISCARS
jgi:peptide/nickel transport system substrate-binding protein